MLLSKLLRANKLVRSLGGVKHACKERKSHHLPIKQTWALGAPARNASGSGPLSLCSARCVVWYRERAYGNAWHRWARFGVSITLRCQGLSSCAPRRSKRSRACERQLGGVLSSHGTPRFFADLLHCTTPGYAVSATRRDTDSGPVCRRGAHALTLKTV